MPNRSSRAVILFSRTPREEEAAKHLPSAPGRAARELLAATRERLARELAAGLPGVVLLVAGPEALPGALALSQRGRTFGERLACAFEDARALGFDEVVLVGGDVPGLSGRHVERAFGALAAGKVALGPCPDGGVYLIGAAGSVTELLADVRWMTSRVSRDLEGTAAAAGREVCWLDALRDVDDRLDLARLLDDGSLDGPTRSLLRRILAPRRVAAVEGRAGADDGVTAAAAGRGPPRLLLDRAA